MKVAQSAGYPQPRGRRVEGFMRSYIDTIDEHTSMMEFTERFIDSTYRRFPMLRGGCIVGVITRRNLLKLQEQTWRPDEKRA